MGFGELVQDKWSGKKALLPYNCYSMDIWHECLVELRKFLRGWHLNSLGGERKLKLGLSKRIEEIDLIAEQRLLSFLGMGGKDKSGQAVRGHE